MCAHDFARAFGGKFLLRIEDIDGTRSRAEHIDAIIADMEWLGLHYDGEVVFQSQRIASYKAALDRDYPIFFANLYIFTLVGLVVGLISDLMYTWIDPRIDFERREV